MADDEVRQLERAWRASGSPADEAAWRAAQRRRAGADPGRLGLAAALGLEGAPPAAPIETPAALHEALVAAGDEALARALVGVVSGLSNASLREATGAWRALAARFVADGPTPAVVAALRAAGEDCQAQASWYNPTGTRDDDEVWENMSRWEAEHPEAQAFRMATSFLISGDREVALRALEHVDERCGLPRVVDRVRTTLAAWLTAPHAAPAPPPAQTAEEGRYLRHRRNERTCGRCARWIGWGQMRQCARCGLPRHDACWTGACTVVGCGGVDAPLEPPPAPPPPPVVPPKEPVLARVRRVISEVPTSFSRRGPPPPPPPPPRMKPLRDGLLRDAARGLMRVVLLLVVVFVVRADRGSARDGLVLVLELAPVLFVALGLPALVEGVVARGALPVARACALAALLAAALAAAALALGGLALGRPLVPWTENGWRALGAPQQLLLSLPGAAVMALPLALLAAARVDAARRERRRDGLPAALARTLGLLALPLRVVAGFADALAEESTPTDVGREA